MYRRERDRAHQLRMWKRYHKLRSREWSTDFYLSWVGSTQMGRFRKSSELGCPTGHCGVCRRSEPTRQEVRAELSFKEWENDYYGAELDSTGRRKTE